MKRWRLCSEKCFFCCLGYKWKPICNQDTYDNCIDLDVTSLIKAEEEEWENAKRNGRTVMIHTRNYLESFEDGELK